MTDKRLLAISNILASYSQGEFNVEEIELSGNLDEIDSIISSINMLGEELKETTISRNFFSNIYNTVTDMLFVVDHKYQIIDTNVSTKEKLGEKVQNKNFFSISSLPDEINCFEDFKTQPSNETNIYKFETQLQGINNDKLFVSCSVTEINRNNHSQGYLIIAEDVTLKKDSEKQIFRAVLETQERERKRVADDLHDSIGQELSSIKMMLGVVRTKVSDPSKQSIINSTIDILDDSIQDLRNICFNLMPSVLETGGLIYAIQQLIDKTNLKTLFNSNVDEIHLEKAAQVSIYRVIQEFINNSMKHSGADIIKIDFQQTGKGLIINMSDNGKGFEIKNNSQNDGRGLNTMRSRVETFGGNFVLLSKPGDGVHVKITFL